MRRVTIVPVVWRDPLHGAFPREHAALRPASGHGRLLAPTATLTYDERGPWRSFMESVPTRGSPFVGLTSLV